jgi:hypothetical protein
LNLYDTTILQIFQEKLSSQNTKEKLPQSGSKKTKETE